jgi:SAM-dependent methyltransferase
MSPAIKDYLVFSGQLVSGKRTRLERSMADKRLADIQSYFPSGTPLRVLDLANGRLRPQYYLLKAAGHEVTGIDLVNGSRSGWVDIGYRLARWLYTLHTPINNRFNQANNLVCGDVSRLPFVGDYFDLVTSVAAFEHFLDVPAVVSELKRVLHPGGIAWIGFHLFTSPSGGHTVGFTEIPLRKIPSGIQPWDHLRLRKLLFTVPLNQFRLPHYLEIFSANFEILKYYCVAREGEHLLTPEIEAELSEYSREELTSRSCIIVVRKT